MLLVGRQEGHPACRNLLLQNPCIRIKEKLANPGFPGEWPLSGMCLQGVARNLLRGRGQKRRSGDGSPQWGPGAEPRWGLEAKPPEARDTCWIFDWTYPQIVTNRQSPTVQSSIILWKNFQLRPGGGTCTHVPPWLCHCVYMCVIRVICVSLLLLVIIK